MRRLILFFLIKNTRIAWCAPIGRSKEEEEGRKETTFYCDTCDRKADIHQGECFKNFHILKNYKYINIYTLFIFLAYLI